MKRTHGATVGPIKTREYRAWQDAKKRCYNSHLRTFHLYGGRGITMAPEWRHDYSAFLADMGPCPPGMSLDRKDNDGPYASWNCRWATRSEQQRNTRVNRMLTFNGETLCLAAWASRYELDRVTLHGRLYVLGWPLEEALTTRPKARAHPMRGRARGATLPEGDV